MGTERKVNFMKIVAITSCATGIAHTYMAAEAIKKECKKKGYACKVEMQGALGIENKLSEKDIKTFGGGTTDCPRGLPSGRGGV